MFNLFFLLSLLTLLLSCEQEVDGTKSLTDAERAYLDELAGKQCLSESDKTFKGFQDNSVTKIRDLERGQSFKVEFLKDKTSIEVFKLNVWKITASDFYFQYETKEGGIKYTKYIKVSESDNDQMISAMQALKCSNSTFTVAANSSLINADRADKERTQSGSDWVENSEAYRFNSKFPAYFGTINMARTLKTSASKTGTVKKTEVYDTVFATTPTKETFYSNYKDARYENIRYCVPQFTISNSKKVYTFPYILKCESADTGVDGNGDGTSDFNPAAELIP